MGAINKKKIILIGDAVAGTSGLARISRDIATRVYQHLNDICEIITFGYGSPSSPKLGFHQLVIEGMDSWVLPTLPQICEDFFGKERGIILYVWDLSRTGWLSQPQRLGGELLEKFPGLQQWAINANIERWIYCPLDGAGPKGKLTFPMALALYGFDRVLAYGPFGESVIRKTIGDEESDKRHLTNLPHGVNGEIFFELSRANCRKMFFKRTGADILNRTRETPLPPVIPAPIADDEVLIAIIATNQNRKNFGLGLATVAEIAKKHKVRLWVHTDQVEKYWSVPALVVDYGLLHLTVMSLGFISDEYMAEALNAADLMLGIGPEGFGLPLAEALACGTPVITGSYAGAADFVPKAMQVEPMKDASGYPAFYLEGVYATERPVYSPLDWAAKAEEWIGKRTSLDEKYEWTNNWPRWEAWFREALNANDEG